MYLNEAEKDCTPTVFPRSKRQQGRIDILLPLRKQGRCLCPDGGIGCFQCNTQQPLCWKRLRRKVRKFKTTLLCRINLVCFLVEKFKLSISRSSEIFNKKITNYVVLRLGDTSKHKVWFQIEIWDEKKPLSKTPLISFLPLLNGIHWELVSTRKKSWEVLTVQKYQREFLAGNS